MAEPGVRMLNLPDLGEVTDDTRLVGTRMGAGSYNIEAVREYVQAARALNIRELGAKGDGVTDDTAVFAAAFVTCREQGAELHIPPGTYKIGGTLNPAGVSMVGPGYYNREVLTYTDRGAVLLHASPSAPLFAPTEGFSCTGIIFYDPFQIGTGATPVVRPALIEVVPGQHFVDWTFQNNTVVNAYHFLDVPADCVGGDWRIDGNRIYSVASVFRILGLIPESMFISNNIISPGIYQSVAVFANDAMLGKYSGQNAAVFEINAPGKTIDGLKSCNNLYYGYRYLARIQDGLLNLPTFTGDQFDAVQSIFDVRGGGALVGATITGGVAYCYTYGSPSTAGNAMFFETTGECSLSVSGLIAQACSGSWIIVNGTNVVNINGDFGAICNWGTATGLATDAYVMAVGNPLAEVRLSVSRVAASYANSIGLLVAKANRVTVLGTTFRGCKLPVQVANTIAPGARVQLVGCGSHLTFGEKSVTNSAAPGVVVSYGSAWDKVSDV